MRNFDILPSSNYISTKLPQQKTIRQNCDIRFYLFTLSPKQQILVGKVNELLLVLITQNILFYTTYNWIEKFIASFKI